MPIEIYTGKPGNGKTALMMERLIAEAKKGERPIYAAGIDGLQPGLATVLDDVRRWNEFDAEGNRIVPDGALVFVDEAWKWFGHLHDASRQATPKWVLDLAEHRHRGIDFVWTAQGPNQIYPFARPLIADHVHVVRRFGTSFIETFKWEELQEDVKSTAKRENSLRKTRTLPADVFGSYKSAEVHTIKRNVPWRVVAIPGLALIAVLCAWLAYTHLRPSAFAKQAQTEPAPAQAGAGSPVPASSSSREKKPRMTIEEYTELHTPRFATMPHTMPLFDDRAPVSDPQLFCMSTKAGLDGNGDYDNVISCTCLTEQGTKYEIDEGICMRVARWGQPYNPYKQPAQQASNQWQSQPVVPSPPVTAASGTSQPFGTVARYGRDGLGAY